MQEFVSTGSDVLDQLKRDELEQSASEDRARELQEKAARERRSEVWGKIISRIIDLAPNLRQFIETTEEPNGFMLLDHEGYFQNICVRASIPQHAPIFLTFRAETIGSPNEFGEFTAYSLQQISPDNDSRLYYVPTYRIDLDIDDCRAVIVFRTDGFITLGAALLEAEAAHREQKRLAALLEKEEADRVTQAKRNLENRDDELGANHTPVQPSSAEQLVSILNQIIGERLQKAVQS